MSSSRSERAAILTALLAIAMTTSSGACSFRDLSDLTGGDAAGPPPDAAPVCEKDCLGGACIAGKCQPVTLIDGRAQPWGIAVDGNGDVYWSELGAPGHLGAAYKLIPGATSPASAYVIADVEPTWLFAFKGKLYWSSLARPFAIGRCPIPGAGCTFHPNSTTPAGSIVASGSVGTVSPYVNFPDRVVADASGVYWTNQGSAIGTRDGSILVCRATGCGSPPPQTLAFFQSHPRGIAVDDAYVYWVNQGLGIGMNDGAVLRISKVPGGTAEQLAENQPTPGYIAVDDKNVYWTNGDDGTVMFRPKSGIAQPQKFADGQGGALDIVVDDSGVYWTTNGPSGTVAMCPTTGCDGGVTVLARVSSPYGIALDANAVYWTTNDLTMGAVMKVAKP